MFAIANRSISSEFEQRPFTDRMANSFWSRMASMRAEEVLDAVIEKVKCGSVNPTLGGNGGRFAWLSNHDYEIQIKTRITVKDERSGTFPQDLPQLIFFPPKAPMIECGRQDRRGNRPICRIGLARARHDALSHRARNPRI